MTYKGWIIYKKVDAMKNQDYITWFIQAAKKENIHLQLMYREEIAIDMQKDHLLYEGKNIVLPHFAVVRTMDFHLSKQLEYLHIQTFNSSIVSEMTNDKVKAYQYVQSLQIPILSTFAYPANVYPVSLPIPYPFVMKSTTGKGGDAVFYVTDSATYEDAKGKLTNTPYLIQSANVQLGKDLRVFIVNNTIITAILRENKTDFRANYTLGGNASVYQLSREEKEIIQEILASYTFDFVGIDFLIDNNGNLIFNEIEDVVGSRMVSHLTDINIVAIYVKHIYQTIQQQDKKNPKR